MTGAAGTTLAFVGIALAWLAGCASAPAISARMDDAAVRAVLAEKCPTGSSQAQVNAGLDALGVSKGTRLPYAATEARPPVLLARLFENRGPWLESDDSDVKWLDISFVFSRDDHLERTLLFRDKLRYLHHEPIIYPNSPKRALQKRPAPFPAPIPPPVDPLEGAS